jgi:hypothetical protein
MCLGFRRADAIAPSVTVLSKCGSLNFAAEYQAGNGGEYDAGGEFCSPGGQLECVIIL